MSDSYITPSILHDAPLRNDDRADFHFDKFAITLARLIAAKQTRTPLTIGVSGPWGAGKTTLLQRVQKSLESQDFYDIDESDQFRSCKTVWFDAWKYDDEDELLAALIRVILNTMSAGNWSDKFWKAWLDPNQPDYDVLAMFLNAFKVKFGGIEVHFDPQKHAAESVFKTNTSFFDYFDEAIEMLLARWVHGKGDYKKIDEQNGALVIFIDDLDRCLPRQTVQVLEAIKLFLDKSGCIFVLGADIRRVQDAVNAHYAQTGVLGDDGSSDYLEKIIQLRFELPPIDENRMADFVKKAKVGESRLIGEDWGENWRILITGAEVNPRKVKTFLNDLSLQWAMLVNSGQAQGVNREDFNAWQVLMRAAPRPFVIRMRTRFRGLPQMRYDYLQAAIAWAGGDESQAGQFREYEEAYNFRRVLQKLAFSARLTPEVLDSFVYLTAPPALEEPPAQSAARTAPDVRGVPETKGLARVETLALAGLEFVKVPAGEFIMGSPEGEGYDDEHPQHTVEIPYDYWIGRFPVTNAQYNEFVQARKKKHPVSDWKKKKDHPVVNVTWYDAMAYCHWLNERIAMSGQPAAGEARLPSEAEWEKAARGTFGNRYPWGDAWDPKKCNSEESGIGETTPVGQFSPAGDSPYGAADMAGNVWEWTGSLYKPYPYDPADGREDLDAPDDADRVLRGGAFLDDHWIVRAAARYWTDPTRRNRNPGFRVVLSPMRSEL